MNLLYIKYAVEVAAAGSINKAAEKLYLDQPNLSRAIRELEATLGTKLFERSARGMKLTPDGEKFMGYAKTILEQVDAVETIFCKEKNTKRTFSVSVPRAGYIAEAFAAFSHRLTDDLAAEVFYRETNADRTVRNVLSDDYKLGIIRYATVFDRQYKEMFDEKGLAYELVAEFSPVLLCRADSPLTALSDITDDDLAACIEVTQGDPYVPSVPTAEVRKAVPVSSDRVIYVFERGSEFDILSLNADAFMWASPVSGKVLDRYGLVQRHVFGKEKTYRDIMIRKKDYNLTDLDRDFISELCRVKRQIIK